MSSKQTKILKCALASVSLMMLCLGSAAGAARPSVPTPPHSLALHRTQAKLYRVRLEAYSSGTLVETTEITLRLQSWYPTALAIDGQTSVALEEQDLIVVRRAQAVARFARVSAASSWYQNLTQRLRRV